MRTLSLTHTHIHSCCVVCCKQQTHTPEHIWHAAHEDDVPHEESKKGGPDAALCVHARPPPPCLRVQVQRSPSSEACTQSGRIQRTSNAGAVMSGGAMPSCLYPMSGLHTMGEHPHTTTACGRTSHSPRSHRTRVPGPPRCTARRRLPGSRSGS